jgi:hypothetical protein
VYLGPRDLYFSVLKKVEPQCKNEKIPENTDQVFRSVFVFSKGQNSLKTKSNRTLQKMARVTDFFSTALWEKEVPSP